MTMRTRIPGPTFGRFDLIVTGDSAGTPNPSLRKRRGGAPLNIGKNAKNTMLAFHESSRCVRNSARSSSKPEDHHGIDLDEDAPSEANQGAGRLGGTGGTVGNDCDSLKTWLSRILVRTGRTWFGKLPGSSRSKSSTEMARGKPSYPNPVLRKDQTLRTEATRKSYQQRSRFFGPPCVLAC
jgi:hypothetical protein